MQFVDKWFCWIVVIVMLTMLGSALQCYTDHSMVYGISEDNQIALWLIDC